jgi:hypothetical protein
MATDDHIDLFAYSGAALLGLVLKHDATDDQLDAAKAYDLLATVSISTSTGDRVLAALRGLLESCSVDERCALLDIADDGFTADAGLDRLESDGLITRKRADREFFDTTPAVIAALALHDREVHRGE